MTTVQQQVEALIKTVDTAIMALNGHQNQALAIHYFSILGINLDALNKELAKSEDIAKPINTWPFRPVPIPTIDDQGEMKRAWDKMRRDYEAEPETPGYPKQVPMWCKNPYGQPLKPEVFLGGPEHGFFLVDFGPKA